MIVEVHAEARETPRWVERRLREAGGTNLYGKPNFRLVWGWNRLTMVCGEWNDHVKDGDETTFIQRVVENRWVPKYTEFFVWHLEMWTPTAVSEETWNEQMVEYDDDGSSTQCGECGTVIDTRQMQQIGVKVIPCPGCRHAVDVRDSPRSTPRVVMPWPGPGDYESVFEFQPFELTESSVNWVIRMIREAQEQAADPRNGERIRERIQAAQARKEAEYDAFCDEQMGSHLDLAFNGPHVSFAGLDGRPKPFQIE